MTRRDADALASRFYSQITLGPVTDSRLGPCLVWTGSVNGSGYGNAYDGHRAIGAHVYAVLLSGTPVPPGHEVDHLCRVRPCVRRDHLRVLTGADNRAEASWRTAAERARARLAERAAAAAPVEQLELLPV